MGLVETTAEIEGKLGTAKDEALQGNVGEDTEGTPEVGSYEASR